MQPNSSADVAANLSVAEVARFDALAAEWWDPTGPMRPLHAMNPIRVKFVHDRIAPSSRLLDVGCGAGLAAEALAGLGHDVLGIDMAGAALDAARAHAEGAGLRLAYRQAITDDLIAEPERFPVITAFEVIEHVPDPAAFVASLAALLAPGGVLFISTLNRTKRAWLTAKFGAEYVLRLLPVGTHDWGKFIPPAQLGAMARDAGLRVTDSAGLMPTLGGGWELGRDLNVNYVMGFQG